MSSKDTDRQSRQVDESEYDGLFQRKIDTENDGDGSGKTLRARLQEEHEGRMGGAPRVAEPSSASPKRDTSLDVSFPTLER